MHIVYALLPDGCFELLDTLLCLAYAYVVIPLQGVVKVVLCFDEQAVCCLAFHGVCVCWRLLYDCNCLSASELRNILC
jgi:hypothetical protein